MDKYVWTNHAKMKLRFYRLSEGKIKRIIRNPKRVEEGIALNTIAVMQPAQSKKYQEIWTMYQIAKAPIKSGQNKIRIISAWRYPGLSPKKNPIPKEILQEVRDLLIS